MYYEFVALVNDPLRLVADVFAVVFDILGSTSTDDHDGVPAEKEVQNIQRDSRRSHQEEQVGTQACRDIRLHVLQGELWPGVTRVPCSVGF